MKKVIVFIGSNNRQSFTKKMIENIFNTVDTPFEVEYVLPEDLDLRSCMGCSHCFYNGKCVIRDDSAELIERVGNCDLFIIGSPTYVHHISSETKKLIDRWGYLTHCFRFLGKPCLTVASTDSSGASFVSSYLFKVCSYLGFNVISKAHFYKVDPKLENEISRNAQIIDSYFISSEKTVVPELEAIFNTIKMTISKLPEDRFEKKFFYKHSLFEFETIQAYLNSSEGGTNV